MPRQNHLRQLESDAIHILREVAGQFERPVALFSGGKDSITLAWLARKAFAPGISPLPLLHIDTGHNFPETLAYRDWFVQRYGARLVVRSVQDTIDRGRAVRRPVPLPAATRCSPSRCWTRCGSWGPTARWAADGGTRRRRGRRSASSRTATPLGSGTRSTNGRSCGRSTTGAATRGSISGCFRCRTGRSWTFGSTSPAKASRCRACTSPTAAGCSSARGCCWPRRRLWRWAGARFPRSARCGFAPWGTPPAPRRSSRMRPASRTSCWRRRRRG